MPGPFTPAFEKITQKLVRGLGKEGTLRGLFTNIFHLSEKEIAEKLQDIFLSTVNHVPASRIETFLQEVATLSNDLELREKLESIRLLHVAAEKEEALKKLLLDKNIRTFFARHLKKAEGFNPDELFNMVNEENLKVAQREAQQRAEQANVGSMEGALIRQAFRLLFQFIDLALVSMGNEPVFTPRPQEETSEKEAGQKIKYIPMPK